MIFGTNRFFNNFVKISVGSVGSYLWIAAWIAFWITYGVNQFLVIAHGVNLFLVIGVSIIADC